MRVHLKVNRILLDQIRSNSFNFSLEQVLHITSCALSCDIKPKRGLHYAHGWRSEYAASIIQNLNWLRVKHIHLLNDYRHWDSNWPGLQWPCRLRSKSLWLHSTDLLVKRLGTRIWLIYGDRLLCSVGSWTTAPTDQTRSALNGRLFRDSVSSCYWSRRLELSKKILACRIHSLATVYEERSA